MEDKEDMGEIDYYNRLQKWRIPAGIIVGIIVLLVFGSIFLSLSRIITSL